MSNIKKLANPRHIRKLLGDVNNDLVVAVLDTGASYEDIAAAVHWMDDDEVRRPGDLPVLSRKAKHICDVLASMRKTVVQDKRIFDIP